MIDELDKKILNMLIANGRQSSREITKKLAEAGFKISERGLGKRIARQKNWWNDFKDLQNDIEQMYDSTSE